MHIDDFQSSIFYEFCEYFVKFSHRVSIWQIQHFSVLDVSCVFQDRNAEVLMAGGPLLNYYNLSFRNKFHPGHDVLVACD